MTPCELCHRPARFQVVNDTDRDGWACGLHLALVVTRLTVTGWAKIDVVDGSS